MRNLVVFGDSQYAERISKYIVIEGRDKLVAFTQEHSFISRKEINGVPVIPFEQLNHALMYDFEIVLGIGYTKMNTFKRKIFDLCKQKGYKIAN